MSCVDLGDAAFLGAHDAGEIAPMVDDQRHVGIGRLADRLAVVERLDQRQQFQIGLELSAILLRMRERSATEVLPQASLASWAASSASSTSAADERGTSQSFLPVIGLGLSK